MMRRDRPHGREQRHVLQMASPVSTAAQAPLSQSQRRSLGEAASTARTRRAPTAAAFHNSAPSSVIRRAGRPTPGRAGGDRVCHTPRSRPGPAPAPRRPWDRRRSRPGRPPPGPWTRAGSHPVATETKRSRSSAATSSTQSSCPRKVSRAARASRSHRISVRSSRRSRPAARPAPRSADRVLMPAQLGQRRRLIHRPEAQHPVRPARDEAPAGQRREAEDISSPVSNRRTSTSATSRGASARPSGGSRRSPVGQGASARGPNSRRTAPLTVSISARPSSTRSASGARTPETASAASVTVSAAASIAAPARRTASSAASTPWRRAAPCPARPRRRGS